MDISSKFSLVDFLAYLFPGFVSFMGIYLLLLRTFQRHSLTTLSLDFFLSGILVLALSYVIGVILSGFAEVSIKYLAERRKKEWYKDTIPVPGFKNEILTAFLAGYKSGLFTREE